MNKAIITVGGDNLCKRAFQKILKEELHSSQNPSPKAKRTVWSADPLKELGYIIGLLGWDGEERNQVFQDVYSQIYNLVEKTFEFKRIYLQRTIDRFWSDEIAKALVIYNADELVEDLKSDDGLFNLYIAKNQKEADENLNKYDKVILMDKDFKESITQTINILTKEIEKI